MIELTIEPKFIEISTDKTRYLKGENVTIYMKNISDITLNQSSGWENYIIYDYIKGIIFQWGNNTIFECKGDIVYQQSLISQQLPDLSPNEKVTVGVWHQTYQNGTQVPSGYYIIEKYYAGHFDENRIYILG